MMFQGQDFAFAYVDPTLIFGQPRHVVPNFLFQLRLVGRVNRKYKKPHPAFGPIIACFLLVVVGTATNLIDESNNATRATMVELLFWCSPALRYLSFNLLFSVGIDAL